ncbi:MAG: tRNA (guanosine(37)-N1)-methyltransferase TrmD [Candidatus Pacebacteria bacterium]|nr:tRNA (guanosine(37)-N1)-methyltransferase TrmD [Candidatus Paceibacterota bacterium]MBP9715517.1 tRNA (guanosine(37)-N1)-methyltransferase TrmD [Candidatus Paceibacterota bacterium]
MKFHFLTIFPEMINSYIGEAMLKRAKDKKLVDFAVLNIRDYSKDRHSKTDLRPYGGGPGMVMTPEPILNAYSKVKTKKNGKVKVIMLSPSGKMFTNVVAKKMVKSYTDIVFICGRYEGVDDRVRKALKADEYSIGDYVLTGGELPALVMTDAISRQIPGVLGDRESLEEARIASPRVYTRPETVVFKTKKYKVPKVLTEGHHKKIEEWRQKQKKK